MNHLKTNPKALPEFQRKVADFVSNRGLGTTPHARLLDLSSEIGELAKEALKATDYGREPFEDPTDDWEDEMGDVFFSLACLANSTGVDLEAALQSSLDKYKERLRREGNAGSGGRDG